MTVKTVSLWAGVPDADTLRDKLTAARNKDAPLHVRQEALSYLTGATKVLERLENRRALAEYLRSQIRQIKAKLYYH